MRKGLFPRGAVLGVLALLFAACPMEPDEGVSRFGPKVSGAEFSGTWTSNSGDQFNINTTANTFTYSFGSTPDYGDMSMDYSGNIVGEVLADKTLLQSKHGYLTIKVTNAGGYGPTVDKFFVVHWKDLTSGSVKEAGAYKQGGQNTGVDTAEAAAAEYTVEKDYFGMYGVYGK
jgi:hypothetical protein